LSDFSILLNSRLLISSPGAVPKDAVLLAPAKALKTGAHSTPHTAPQPPPALDLEAAAARLREAVARGAQAAQQAREKEGDAGQSDAGHRGAEAAAQAADAEETGQGGAGGAAQAVIDVEAGQGDADIAARPDIEGETGGGAQEHPAGQTAEETPVFEPSRAEGEGLAEDMAQEAPAVEGAPILKPTEARDEGTVAIVPVPTAQEGATAVVELLDSSEEYGDSMDIDPAAAASAAAHIAEFASASAGVLEAGASEGSHLGVIVPSGVPSEFLRKEQEEEEAWNKQMGVGREILQALDRAYQLHQNADYQVSQVSISPRELLGFGLVLACLDPRPPFRSS